LRDRTEVLFYRLLTDHLPRAARDRLHPTVGAAVERYSHEYRRPCGGYLSADQLEAIERALASAGRAPGDVDT
jgi:malate dehydrogenase (oxaloacetate-decarboxylating)